MTPTTQPTPTVTNTRRNDYAALRRKGYRPRTILGAFRSLDRADAFMSHATDLTDRRDLSVTLQVKGDALALALPLADLEALRAMDPDLTRWAVEVVVTPDDFPQEDSLEAQGIETVEVARGVDFDDVGECDDRFDVDPRPHGGHIPYVEIPRGSWSSPWRVEYAYIPPEDLHYWTPKGASKGTRDLLTREAVARSLEAMVAERYSDAGTYGVTFRIRFDGEVVGEDTLWGLRGGDDTYRNDEHAAVAYAFDHDVVGSALVDAERWATTAREERIERARALTQEIRETLDFTTLPAVARQ